MPMPSTIVTPIVHRRASLFSSTRSDEIEEAVTAGGNTLSIAAGGLVKVLTTWLPSSWSDRLSSSRGIQCCLRLVP